MGKRSKSGSTIAVEKWLDNITSNLCNKQIGNPSILIEGLLLQRIFILQHPAYQDVKMHVFVRTMKLVLKRNCGIYVNIIYKDELKLKYSIESRVLYFMISD